MQLKAFTNTRNVLWSKENLINCAISWAIRQRDAEYIAWIDADIEFESESWVADTIHAIEGTQSTGGLVQLFSTGHALGPDNATLFSVPSFCKQVADQQPYTSRDSSHRDYWHPGFAWAASSSTLLRLSGGSDVYLIECTLGGADRHMAMAVALQRADETVPASISQAYRDMVVQWQARAVGMTVGCVAGALRHYWHGSFESRQYVKRWDILAQAGFVPAHMGRRPDGVLEWAASAPAELLPAVAKYFRDRNEDSTELPPPQGAISPAQVPITVTPAGAARHTHGSTQVTQSTHTAPRATTGQSGTAVALLGYATLPTLPTGPTLPDTLPAGADAAQALAGYAHVTSLRGYA
jgi:hypothetical protein